MHDAHTHTHTGEWSPWGSWSSCSATCDTGFRTRERQCTGCTAQCCVCPVGDATFEIEECLQEFCSGISKSTSIHTGNHVFLPIGSWSQWGPWEACSRTCGGGFRTRERVCEGNGPCDFGSSFDYEDCNENSCCSK